jgi:predicted small integral membrane protein
LLLWTAGIVLYCKGFARASAIALALAAAIKLTPVIVFVPFLLWKDWRWLRWFFGSLAACVGLICIVNGPATLADFLFHVMPPMSAGIPGILNTSLPGAIEMLYAGITGVDVENVYYITVPAAVITVGKLASAACLLAAFACLVRIARPAEVFSRAKILALIALLATCTSPVAWRHAYTVVIPLLFLLWHEALHRECSYAWLVMLGFATIEFGFIVDTLIAKVAHGWAFGAVPLIGPVCGLILIFHELARMTRLRQTDAVA